MCLGGQPRRLWRSHRSAFDAGRAKERSFRSSVQTEYGELAGSDRGEWIGDLRLKKPGGGEQIVLKENVVGFLPVKSGVLVLTGLLHLDADYGTAWLFDKSNARKWALRKLFDLKGMPRAIGSDGRNTLALTNRGVSRINSDLKLDEIEIDPFPVYDLSPFSVTGDERERVYVGMHGFVVRLTPRKNGYSRQWFSRPPCSL